MILSPLGAIAKKKKFHRNLAICLSYTFILVAPVYSQSGIRNDYTVDYEGVDCSKSYTVTNNDVYTLVATPRQDVETGLTFCRNQFVAPDGRTLKIYVIDLKIGSCGVTIKIYDNDPNMVREPRWSLGCRGSTEQLQSYSKTIIVRLQKPTADSTSLYNFKLVVTTDQGPTINVEDYQTMDGGGASSGVIAGIGIAAGLVVVVIVVVIAVVYCRYAKRKEEEKYQQKPSSVFSTTNDEASVTFGTLPAGSRRSQRTDPRANQGRRGRRNHGYEPSEDSTVVSKKNPIPMSGEVAGQRFMTESETGPPSKLTREKPKSEEPKVKRLVQVERKEIVNKHVRKSWNDPNCDSIDDTATHSTDSDKILAQRRQDAKAIISSRASKHTTEQESRGRGSSRSPHRGRERNESPSRERRYSDRGSPERHRDRRDADDRHRRSSRRHHHGHTRDERDYDDVDYRHEHRHGSTRDKYENRRDSHRKNYDDRHHDDRRERRSNRRGGYESDSRYRDGYQSEGRSTGRRRGGYESDSRSRSGYTSDVMRSSRRRNGSESGNPGSQRHAGGYYSDVERGHRRSTKHRSDKYYIDYDSDHRPRRHRGGNTSGYDSDASVRSRRKSLHRRRTIDDDSDDESDARGYRSRGRSNSASRSRSRSNW